MQLQSFSGHKDLSKKLTNPWVITLHGPLAVYNVQSLRLENDCKWQSINSNSLNYNL